MREYNSLCQAELTKVKAPKVKPFVEASYCTDAKDSGDHYKYQYSGVAVVSFNRDMNVETKVIQSRTWPDILGAQLDWQTLCQNWLNEQGEKARARNLVETCGTPITDTVYERPSISSRALRISTARTEWRSNDYCYCREDYHAKYGQDHHGHPWVRYVPFYDLMMLNDNGFYQKMGSSYELVSACQDAMNQIPKCAEE
jgi:hypothetical protein